MVRLRQHDAIEHGVEPPIAVEAMTHESSGGRLRGRHTGVGGQQLTRRQAIQKACSSSHQGKRVES
jgi:hypothetical protein